MTGPAITLRFMAEWPPHAIDEDERAAVLAGAEALEDVDRLMEALREAEESCRLAWATANDLQDRLGAAVAARAAEAMEPQEGDDHDRRD